MGRMERYDSSNRNTVRSRTEKNKDLYNDLGRLEKYTTLTDVSKIDAVELSAAKKNYRTREGYHPSFSIGPIINIYQSLLV